MIARTLLLPRIATCFATYRVQRSPTRTLCALSAENLSRTLALLAFVDLNLGDCTAYALLWASKTGRRASVYSWCM